MFFVSLLLSFITFECCPTIINETLSWLLTPPNVYCGGQKEINNKKYIAAAYISKMAIMVAYGMMCA